MRHFQNLHQRLAHQFFVLWPESADRVVIRRGVRAEHAHRNDVIARLFNAPAAKHARAKKLNLIVFMPRTT